MMLRADTAAHAASTNRKPHWPLRAASTASAAEPGCVRLRGRPSAVGVELAELLGSERDEDQQRSDDLHDDEHDRTSINERRRADRVRRYLVRGDSPFKPPLKTIVPAGFPGVTATEPSAITSPG